MPESLLKFTKASACGNDFLLVKASELKDGRSADLADFSRRLCDRHNGIGADGVEWLYSDPGHDVRARLFNADGSEAEISGNGTRCVAAYLVQQAGLKEVSILTGAGTKTCRLLRRDGWRFRFSMQMGQAEVAGERQLEVAGRKLKAHVVSTGNPHFVMLVEQFPAKWQDEAAAISTHKEFPQGTNVELVRVLSPNSVEFRIYERGAGETRSSGTGSCASAVAAIHAGRVKSPVEVRAPGGVQTVRWDRHSLELEGDADLIGRGEFFL
jgi:diaminopimelate epimerase